jgi:hypothetical protein
MGSLRSLRRESRTNDLTWNPEYRGETLKCPTLQKFGSLGCQYCCDLGWFPNEVKGYQGLPGSQSHKEFQETFGCERPAVGTSR